MTPRFAHHRVAAAAIGALALLAATPAQAVRTTTDGGTEIDFSSTISFGLQVRAAKRLSTTIGNDFGALDMDRVMALCAKLGFKLDRVLHYRAEGLSLDAMTRQHGDDIRVNPE